MKNSILTTIVTLICVLILASCGIATDTSSNVTSVNTTEPTTAVVTTVQTTHPTTIATTAIATQPTTIATTAKPHTTVKKTAAKTVAHTSKKTAAKATKKKVATNTKKTESSYKQNAGLTDAEVLWAQEKANEYIKTLKGVTLEPTAGGYTISSGIPQKCTTKEKLLERLKSAIDCDYQSSLDAGWETMGMYLKMEKNSVGNWVYTVMNICYL